MNETDVVLRLGVALAVGFGIGVERGYSHRDTPDTLRATGVRTFTFLALIGAGCGLSMSFAGPWLLAAVALGVIAFLIAAYWAGTKRSPDLGLTTEMAAISAFLVGVLSGAGELLASALIGAAAILFLHNKRELHAFTAGLQRPELDAAVKLLAIAAILLPLSPDKGFGPDGVVNPREIALALVIIATLGLAGYAAIRILGPGRGVLAFGFFGGLVSSTGVTISAAKLAQNDPANASRLASAAALAQAVMFARTGIVAMTLNPSLFAPLAAPVAAGMAVAGISAAILNQNQKAAPPNLTLGSPDTLNAAARFVLIAVGVMIAAAMLSRAFGGWGLYLSGFAAGLVDVDAATLTAARLSERGGSGAFAVILGLTANSLSKTFIAWRIGGPAMGVAAGIAFLGSALAMALALVVSLAAS